MHCYKPKMREKVKTVMRYSGSRMLLYKQLLTIHHLIYGRKKPEKTSKEPR
ncbi:MAG: nitrous oxide-stimulated promoter family protein [Candidatus Bathyarchaeota archaeon]|nr:nitrous oxide-stimulated promoter family protein [Candidatus Bathyarchaeota archaeon]